jgi:hypothetical protein
MALAYAGLGEKRTAIKYLKEAFDLNSPSAIFADLDRGFRPLESEPEFKRLLKRLDKPPANKPFGEQNQPSEGSV